MVPQIHAYVFGDPPDQRASGEDLDVFAEAIGFRSVAERGNVHLMSPYYVRGARHGVRRLQGHSVVSDVQLFLDLYNYPVRGWEQAEHLLDTVLRPRLVERALEGHGDELESGDGCLNRHLGDHPTREKG